MSTVVSFIFGGLIGLAVGLFVARSGTTGTLSVEVLNPEKSPYLYLTIYPKRQMDLYTKSYIMVKVENGNQNYPRY